MQRTDDAQDALEWWDADDTQWIITDGGYAYAVCTEDEAPARPDDARLGNDEPGRADAH